MTLVFTPIGLLVRREALGLSQAGLAQILGVTPLTLHRWERGQRSPADPTQVEQALVYAETIMSNLVERIFDTTQRQVRGDQEASIHVFRSVQEWHAVDPVAAEHGLPKSFYRIAVARASVALREDLGVTARIYTV